MHSLAARLLDHIRRHELLAPGDRVVAAVSGGADSTALLRLLLDLRSELGIVLSVVHFNHQLRGAESDQDEHFVSELAHRHDLEFHLGSADTAAYSRDKDLTLEEAARDLRYDFFAQLITNDAALDKVATGHTLDDQAETVLMRVIRGTGLRGLGGIHPRVLVEGQDETSENEDGSEERAAEIIRPLLNLRHRELEAYLREIGQVWREDSSNADSRFTRNRIRSRLLPLLEHDFNPAITENLAELADIARAEEDYWQNEIAGWMGTGIHWTEPDWARPASGAAGDLVQLQPANPDLQRRLAEEGPLVMDAAIDLVWLLSEPLAVQRRIIKAIGDLAGFPLEFKHIEEVLQFAHRPDGSGKRIALPLGWSAELSPQALTFRTADLRTEDRVPANYEYPLAIPGNLRIPEAGVIIEVAHTALDHADPGYNPDILFDDGRVPQELIIRNWRPGDRFWPAHTKAPKKVKELLQERGITGQAKKCWPVLEHGGELLWVRDFATPAALQPSADAKRALRIRALPVDSE